MKLNVVLLIVGLPLLAVGGEGLYQAARHRQQTPLTCSQFQSQIPASRWVRLTGCEIDYTNPGIVETGGRIEEIYFPVRPSRQPRTTPAPLVAVTRDAEALAIAQATIGDYKIPDQEAFDVMMLRAVTALKAAREVEGYIRGGPLERIQSRRALSGMKSPLTPSFVVLDLHGQPPRLAPRIEAGAGATLLLLYGLTRPRRRQSPAATEPLENRDQFDAVPLEAAPEILAEIEPSSTTENVEAPANAAAAVTPLDLDSLEMPDAHGAPPLLEERPLVAKFEAHTPLQPASPAMMALNLPGDAGVDAIEHAPALGSRADVEARCVDAWPGLVFNGSGHAVVSDVDAVLTLALGTAEPVWTMTVTAHGRRGEEAARLFAVRTGWRLYVPKRGVFVEPGARS